MNHVIDIERLRKKMDKLDNEFVQSLNGIYKKFSELKKFYKIDDRREEWLDVDLSQFIGAEVGSPTQNKVFVPPHYTSIFLALGEMKVFIAQYLKNICS